MVCLRSCDAQTVRWYLCVQCAVLVFWIENRVLVGILRAEAGRDPHNPDLQDLIGQLSTLSEEFRTRWGAHDVRRHDTGEKHFHHHIVGDLHLQFESTDLPADPGWKLQIYTAEPASTTADALRLLASWAATREQNPPPTEAAPPARSPTIRLTSDS